MKINIHAGQRVLYKQNGQWHIGELAQDKAFVDKGLFLPVIRQEDLYSSIEPIMVEINDLFLEAEPVEDWMRIYGNLVTKEEYINIINSDDFSSVVEQAYVSDGDYYYYPISKFNEKWLEKQPFDYVVRNVE